MSELTDTPQAEKAEKPAPESLLHVAPGPHLTDTTLTTRRMMIDVLVALTPVVLMGLYVFQWGLFVQIGICIAACLAAEALFTAMRRRPLQLHDGSAIVTGAILALSFPLGAPWYVGFIGSFAAIGLGKIAFGGMGANIFNPAMVGRAFVMIAFPAALGASAYILPECGIDGLTAATPLTAIKQAGQTTPLLSLFLGITNGSLGETSALACLLGGLYLVIRRTASWEIPAGVGAAILLIGGLVQVTHPGADWTVIHHLFSGALLFGAFFIATDPVSSPLTPLGKFIFGVGTGALVLLIRGLSGYPEGMMFAVLLMNAVVPLINRWTIPTPVGGPVPAPKPS